MIGLLDTHAFLWAVAAPEKLSPKMRSAIENPDNEIHVSTVSFWEIAVKFSLGKLEISGMSPEDLVGVAMRLDFSISGPTVEESASFYRLPKLAHKDPFDRILIWQCLQRRWTFITRDVAVNSYREIGLQTAW